MRNIYIYRIIGFLTIFFILWKIVFSIVWLDETPIHKFYNEKDNTIDIAIIGSSNTYIQYNSTLSYNLYGYTTELLSTDSMPFLATRYLIKESQKYQNKVKLYVIDLSKLVSESNSYNEGDIRRTTDSLKFSKNRIDLINDLLEYTNINSSKKVEYYFSYLLYHNKWKEIYSNLFVTDYLFKGYRLSEKQTEKVKNDKFYWSNEKLELQQNNNEILNDLLNFLQENNLNAIFIIPPRHFMANDNKRLNTAIEIIENNGYKTINFNTLNDFIIDYENDYYDIHHLNVYGATKYTVYLAKYLKENYNLPDHRNDKEYSLWNSEYKRFKTEYNKLTKNDFDIFLNKVISELEE